MKRRIAVVVMLMVLIGIAVAVPNSKIVKETYGATSKEEFEKIMDYAVAGDQEAALAAMEEGLIYGTVKMLHIGDQVYFEGCEGWLCELNKIRYPGETTIYWTITEAVEK